MGKIIILSKLQLKIFLKNKFLIIFSIIFPLFFSIFFSLIFTDYDNVNKIPIAIIDQDNSSTSIELISKLYNNESINIVSEDLNDSMKLIKSNKIEAIFIIKKKFEINLQNSEYNKSIDLLYLDKSSIGPALGDIIASDIMTELAIYKAGNSAVYYDDKYNLNSSDIFNETINIGYQFKNENFFDMNTENFLLLPNSKILEDMTIEDILKTNTTLGYSLIVFSSIILFSHSYIIDKYNINTTKQLISYGYNSIHIYLGNAISIFLSGQIILIGQLMFFIKILNINTFYNILIVYLILSLHLLFLTNFILFFTSIVKNKLQYQSIIAPILFFLSLLGGAFWSVEFLSKEIRWISFFSPIYWSLKLMNGTIMKADLDLFIILIYIIFISIFTIITYIFNSIYIYKLKNNI